LRGPRPYRSIQKKGRIGKRERQSTRKTCRKRNVLRALAARASKGGGMNERQHPHKGFWRGGREGNAPWGEKTPFQKKIGNYQKKLKRQMPTERHRGKMGVRVGLFWSTGQKSGVGGNH